MGASENTVSAVDGSSNSSTCRGWSGLLTLLIGISTVFTYGTLFCPVRFTKGGTPRLLRVALISNPGEDPAPPPTASGHRVARESPTSTAMRKRRCAAVFWHFPREGTMGWTRLLPAGRFHSHRCVFRQPCMYPSGTYPGP